MNIFLFPQLTHVYVYSIVLAQSDILHIWSYDGLAYIELSEDVTSTFLSL
jgi:hypothetical protein